MALRAVSFCVLLALTGVVQAQALQVQPQTAQTAKVVQAQLVKPLQFVNTNLLLVQAPAQDGWYIQKKTKASVTLGHAIDGSNGSLVALASSLKIAPPKNNEHFLEQIRRMIAGDGEVSRLHELQSALDFQDNRGYPCARYTAIHEDREAKVGKGVTTGTMKLLTYSMYCLHPYYRGVVFVASYSYRGNEPYESFDSEAAEFIATVQAHKK